MAPSYYGESWDKWPENFDGKGVYEAVMAGRETGFRINIRQMFNIVEKELSCKVVDVPMVFKGSNNFGFQLLLTTKRTLLLRIARNNFLHPNYVGAPIETVIREVQFEAAVHELLKSDPDIPVSPLLFYRLPVTKTADLVVDAENIDDGRQMMVFDMAKILLQNLGKIRASLFTKHLPLDFVKQWLHSRFPNPNVIPHPVEPTRDFALALLTAKIESMIKNEGDPIGSEDDNHIVGPLAAAAKQSLLNLLPLILPDETETNTFYRFVLEHGDYGVHNLTVSTADRTPRVAALYDWETGHIVPAILSDPEVVFSVDIGIDDEGKAVISRVEDDVTEEEVEEFREWGDIYVQAISDHAPEYISAIRAGKDVRHIWTKLKGWRGDDPEGYFGELGRWAEKRLKELR
ncbi:hypothetical protein HDV00_005572 [Rhizophlyctis rosea]|nr:hypothetical protein HDV00_005572 [Rhizophlyctis rosea]